MMLHDKIIIVTGGSGLLGSEMIKDLSCKGAIAINLDINVKENLESGEWYCDITSDDSIRNAVKGIFNYYGQIDGLVTMLELQKFAEFKALPLKNQLSEANAAYKFCGSGNAEQMPNYDAVKAEVKTMRKAKNTKSATPKTDKTPKAKATDAELLADAILFISSLEVTEEIGLMLAELDATVNSKIDEFNVLV